jgi:large subunit ribosomal protein L17
MQRKFGRKNKHRNQMLTNLVIAILLYEKVTTTVARAKEVRPMVDKAINTAKKNDLSARKNLLAMLLHNKNVTNKLLEDLGPRFKDIKSGFTKIYKISPRVGDNAPRVTVILSKSKFLNNLMPKVQENKIEAVKTNEKPKLKNIK